MPKMKTHRGAAKRLRRTGKGKYKFKRAYHRHNQARLTKFARRRNRQAGHISDDNATAVSRLLPYD